MTHPIDPTQQKIIGEINALGSLKEIYSYLITLGKAHEVNTTDLHRDEFRIPGCLSDAWLKVTLEEDRLHFELDHESVIMQGLLVLVLRSYNHKPAKYIAKTPLTFLEETGLMKQFSQSKSNGLIRVIDHMRETANQHL